LTFENDGPLLLASDYWQSAIAAAGKLHVSINAGCFRLLVPQSQHGSISDMRPKAKHFVVSMLPRDKWDRAPNHEEVGKEWRGSDRCPKEYFMLTDGGAQYAQHRSPEISVRFGEKATSRLERNASLWRTFVECWDYSR
jgi:hypothetical protein